MTDQPRDIQTILNERLELIQAIAAANSENLRLNQIASGMMVLDQKDEIDGAEVDVRSDERDSNDIALEFCRNRIDQLEALLAELDRELKTATERAEE